MKTKNDKYIELYASRLPFLEEMGKEAGFVHGPLDMDVGGFRLSATEVKLSTFISFHEMETDIDGAISNFAHTLMDLQKSGQKLSLEIVIKYGNEVRLLIRTPVEGYEFHYGSEQSLKWT